MTKHPDTSNDRSDEASDLSRCLSMVIHNEEVQLMAEVIEKLLNEKKQAPESPRKK